MKQVSVRVSELRVFYREAVPILKPGGLFLVTEHHSVRRVFNADRERSLYNSHLGARFVAG
jgi:predicted methyltransferase